MLLPELRIAVRANIQVKDNNVLKTNNSNFFIILFGNRFLHLQLDRCSAPLLAAGFVFLPFEKLVASITKFVISSHRKSKTKSIERKDQSLLSFFIVSLSN